MELELYRMSKRAHVTYGSNRQPHEMTIWYAVQPQLTAFLYLFLEGIRPFVGSIILIYCIFDIK